MKQTAARILSDPQMLGVVLLALFLPLAAGCTAVTVGTATVVGADVVLDRRTAGTYIDDNTLELQIRKEIFSHGQLQNSNVSVTIMNGIVLLTGEVGSDAQRKLAARIARSYEGVRQVVNELELAGRTGLGSRANDTWITAKVKTVLMQELGVPTANNIKVVTEAGKVYLMGLVTHEEADRAIAATRTVGGITHIIKVFEYID